ncbi:MAG: hypothetical protein M3Y32_13010 [Pseudomonadota bacterium]|nr:hypothetical protein [Pseudomonadota bacterium]
MNLTLSRRSLLGLPVLSCAVVVLSACSIADLTPTVDDAKRMALSSRSTSRLVLYLQPKPGLDVGKNWDAFRNEWQASMLAACATAGMSFKLAAPGEPRPTEPATVVELTVTELQYVPPAQRLALGVFGSKPSMALDARFSESPSARQVATRNYGSSSGAWQGLYADTTAKQVDLVSLEIVADVLRR